MSFYYYIFVHKKDTPTHQIQCPTCRPWCINCLCDDVTNLATVQVLELVNFCSSRIFESLSEDNALEIGMFGEMHNSEVGYNSSKLSFQNLPQKGADQPLCKVHLLRHDGLAGRGLDGPDSREPEADAGDHQEPAGRAREQVARDPQDGGGHRAVGARGQDQCRRF